MLKENANIVSAKPSVKKEIVNLVYDNGDVLVATYKDWNRTIPSFQFEKGASELIEIAINKGELENSQLVEMENGKAVYSNGAIVTSNGYTTYLEAIKSLR